MNKKITLNEIAKEAGVSITTVSRVINGGDSVEASIKEKIEKIILEKNYRKKKKNSKIISVIIPDITNPFFSSIVEGVQVTASLYGCHIILFQCKDNKSIYEQCINDIKDVGVIGHVIIVPTCKNKNYIEDILNVSEVPIIFLDRKMDIQNINYVGANNKVGAYNACRYLIDLGHKNILYLAGIDGISTEVERFSGFLNALNDDDISFDKDNFYIVGNYDFEESYKQIKNILKEKRVKFTAIFSSSGIMCFGAKNAIEESGLSIPDDISIVGYDNILFSSSINLTTVSSQAYNMGKDAIISLLDIVNNIEKTSVNILLDSNIIIRKSCKRI